ncbi:transmembrane anterior posterior transformation protein 1 homolog isoform X4 [Oncorhynchus clarkii lewisi]|uniref:transmembrane anterior posterior transformation protein 1 homolog isoform X4 n=1 Tax=Oncorhynchus clarkii lewisi TaxID=490388 RepID=UPI0039B895DD
MADLLGTVPSAEKETENKDKKKEKRPWDDIPRSGEIGKTPDLAETLGFYDINAVRREQRERDNSADDLWLLPVSGCLPLRVHAASPPGAAGPATPPHPALLQPRVADRLFSSFGQDILDALYWTATEPKERKRDSIGVIPHFLMAVFYVFLHAILIMVQASTLNVAFNSHNKSLLTIMMSNNFVEIKGSVFKKFEKNNLFQMSNSDIKERFTSYVLLLIVCLRNMEQFSWSPDHLWVLLPDVFMVIASEIAVDVIKHAFITKFNEITADVYSEYRASLAFDLVSCRQKNACTEYSDSVARRMGFIPLPLAVLLIRVVMSSVNVQGALSYSCVFLFYMGMVTLKVLNSIVLLGKSCVYVKRANMEDKLFEKPPTAVPGKTPSRTSKTSRCTAPSGDLSGDPWSERSPSTPFCTSIPPSSSVTTQPIPTVISNPQAETVAPPATSPTSTPTRPSTSPEPDPDTLNPSPPATPEQKEGDGTEGTELKHRTPKKDLLDVDRFTICGNRID